MPSGYPRRLCAKTRIRLLATQSFSFLPSWSNSVLTYSRRRTLSHKWTLTLVKGKIQNFSSVFPPYQANAPCIIMYSRQRNLALICKSTEKFNTDLWQSSSWDQYPQIFISPRESRVSVCLTLTRVRHYLYCHFMVAMVITFLLVFSFSGHLLDFSMVPARGNNYRRRIDPITYTLSNSSRCRLTQSCLCYRSSRLPNRSTPWR